MAQYWQINRKLYYGLLNCVIFSDRGWPLTQISRARCYSMFNVYNIANTDLYVITRLRGPVRWRGVTFGYLIYCLVLVYYILTHWCGFRLYSRKNQSAWSHHYSLFRKFHDDCPAVLADRLGMSHTPVCRYVRACALLILAVLIFSAIFLYRLSQGLGQFVLKFWAKIRRVSGGSCKLNRRGYDNLVFFVHYVALFRKRYNTAVVTMQDEQELVCDLSNGVISNSLQRPLT